MSYTATVWQTGDTITAEKLNKLENGVANTGGYDIVFTETRSELGLPTLTADGASLEELLSSGEKKASYVIDSNLNKSYMQSTGCQQHYASGLLPFSAVGFDFFDYSENAIRSISLTSDGSYGMMSTYLLNGETENYSGTYTYSNGHYVFTLEESGEGGGGGGTPSPT